MIQVPFLQWTDTPSGKGPTSVVAVNFGADVNWTVRLRGGYHDDNAEPQVCVVDNTGNVTSCSVTFNGVANFVPANVRVNFPLASGTGQIVVIGSAGAVNLQFFANAADAPPDQANYAGLFTQAITAAIPTGVIWPFGGSVAPSGWLICDGVAYNRVAQVALFGVIGTLYGPGDGVTTFNVPDGRDAVFIGASPGALSAARPSLRVIGQSGGHETFTLAITNLPAHNHGINDAGHTHTFNVSSGGINVAHTHAPGTGNLFVTLSGGGDGGQVSVAAGGDGVFGSSGTAGGSTGGDSVDHIHNVAGTTSSNASGITTQNTGSATSVDNMPPFFVGTWIIKT